MRRVPRLLATLGVVLLVVLMAVGVAAERGDALGLVALAFYAPFFLGWVLVPEQYHAFWQGHPLLDGLLMAPLMFFALAALTGLSLLACAALGIAAGLVMLAVRQRRGVAG